MTSSPHWDIDPADDAYTLISGNTHCRVWRSMGAWQAIVSHRGAGTVAYCFKTAEDAQQWCERLIEERTQ